MFRMTKMTDYGILLLTQFAAHEDRPAFNARELAQDVHGCAHYRIIVAAAHENCDDWFGLRFCLHGTDYTV